MTDYVESVLQIYFIETLKHCQPKIVIPLSIQFRFFVRFLASRDWEVAPTEEGIEQQVATIGELNASGI